MIKYVENGQINKKKWDACISASFNGNIYAYSWYLNIVAENWDALIENDYERVFPLPWKRIAGLHFLYQPFFTQQLGIFSKNILSADVVKKFIDRIPSKFQHIEIFLNAHNKIPANHWVVTQQVNLELDLIKSYESIRKLYSKNLKRNLNKAAKHKLTFLENVKPEKVVELFRENKGQDISHLGEHDYRRLRRLLYTCMYKRMANFYGVYDSQNTLLAGAVFLLSNKRSIFIFSGLSKAGRDKAAMPFLLDSFIKKHANAHMTLDFDGSNDPNLARFYQSFGAKKITYPKLLINKLPWWARFPFWLKRKL